MTAWRATALALVLLLAGSTWAAEEHWPAENSNDATYPNQGRRLVKNGGFLHVVFDNETNVRYVYSDDLGEHWTSPEDVDLGVNFGDWYGVVCEDGERAWVMGATFARSDPPTERVNGTVRRGAGDYNYGILWDFRPTDSALSVDCISSVLSPSDASEPMVYSVVAATKTDYSGPSRGKRAELFFMAWDTANGTPQARGGVQRIASLTDPGADYHLMGAISVSGHSGDDSIHVAYQSIDDDTSRIYYIRTTNQVNPSRIRSSNMPTWSSPVEISDSSSHAATNPSIDYEDSVLVAWRGPGDNSDVYMAKRKLGRTFDPPVNRTNTPSYESDYPSVWNRCGLAWHEETASHYDIDLSLAGHLCHLKMSDSVSKYPHTAVVFPDPQIYRIVSYTCWTEQTDAYAYDCWFKTYTYIPRGGKRGAGSSAEWLRLEPDQSHLEVYPNPATRDVRLNCFVPREAECRLQVLDLTGRVVRTLFSGGLEAGHHTATWDGRDDAGRRVPRGTYYVRLTAGQSVASEVLTLVE